MNRTIYAGVFISRFTDRCLMLPIVFYLIESTISVHDIVVSVICRKILLTRWKKQK